MNQLNSNTQHQKGKHLSFEERVIIQTRLNDKHSPNKIAAELGCSPNTVRNEIKRGTIYLYNGKVARYKADAGQKSLRGKQSQFLPSLRIYQQAGIYCPC